MVLINSTVFANIITDENIRTDARYIFSQDLLKQYSLSFDEDNISYRETSSGSAILIPVVDDSESVVGLLSVHNEIWRVSFSINQVNEASYIMIDEEGLVKFEKYEESESGFKKTVFRSEDMGKLQEVSMTGSNWCLYTSKIGINFGCWIPDSNPFAYYFVATYREGPRITRFSQSYRADYKGRAVLCPVKDTKVLNLPQCGFPLD